MSIVWMDEGREPDGQPDGFAMPEIGPLGEYASATLTTDQNQKTPPAAFTVTGDPGPRLDQVAPAPPDTRDPRQPFEAGQEDQLSSVVSRDPREPIVTESLNGTPDFAPPTGQPVVAAGAWAPPTGAPTGWGSRTAPVANTWPEASVGAIARPGQPAAGWAPPPAGALPSATSWGAPPPYSGNLPPGMVAVRGLDGQTHRAYRSASGIGKVLVVLQAVPWPALVVLLAGIVFAGGGWSIFALCVSWIICTGNAKVARNAVSRTFLFASGVYLVVWVLSLVAQNSDLGFVLYDLSLTIGRWLCGVLMVAVPVVIWRGLEAKS